MTRLAELLYLSTPAMLHAATVHGPIVLAMLAFAGLLVCAILPRNKTLRWVTIVVHFLLLIAISVTVSTGENAVAQVPSEYSAEVWEHIEAHEELAEAARIAVAAVFVVTALAFVSGRSAGRHLIWLALLGSLGTAAAIALVAHRGGTLVYELGVGTPPPPVLTTAEQPPEPITPLPAPEAPEPEELPTEETAAEEPQASEPSLDYAADIQPIFDQHCTDCHEGDDAASGLDLTSLEGLMKGGNKTGDVVVMGDPDNSPLVQYLEGTRQPQMPKRAPALDDKTIQTIRDWIAARSAGD